MAVVFTLCLGQASSVGIFAQASVEGFCTVQSLAGDTLSLKCTAGTPAPLQPSLWAGVPLARWELTGHTASADGAEVFVYTASAVGLTELSFD